MKNDLKQLELKVERLESSLRTLISWDYDLGKENQIFLLKMIDNAKPIPKKVDKVCES